jgi:enamine deaminase RidA (YjgF/YER057c/UK114 family)
VLTTGAERWLHLAGQIGLRPDRTLPETLEGQIDQCLANIDTALADAGMARADVVKLTFYLTDGAPEAIAAYRARRNAWLGEGPQPAATLLIVAGLAGPGLKVEVDCVAAR